MKEIIPIEEGDFYWSENGFRVFTKQYHLNEGIVVKVVADIAPMAMIQKQTCSKF